MSWWRRDDDGDEPDDDDDTPDYRRPAADVVAFSAAVADLLHPPADPAVYSEPVQPDFYDTAGAQYDMSQDQYRGAVLIKQLNGPDEVVYGVNPFSFLDDPDTVVIASGGDEPDVVIRNWSAYYVVINRRQSDGTWVTDEYGNSASSYRLAFNLW